MVNKLESKSRCRRLDPAIPYQHGYIHNPEWPISFPFKACSDRIYIQILKPCQLEMIYIKLRIRSVQLCDLSWTRKVDFSYLNVGCSLLALSAKSLKHLLDNIHVNIHLSTFAPFSTLISTLEILKWRWQKHAYVATTWTIVHIE